MPFQPEWHASVKVQKFDHVLGDMSEMQYASNSFWLKSHLAPTCIPAGVLAAEHLTAVCRSPVNFSQGLSCGHGVHRRPPKPANGFETTCCRKVRRFMHPWMRSK